jgi:hypothetical protein
MGYTPAEIAESAGVSRSALSDALAQLRQELSDCGR